MTPVTFVLRGGDARTIEGQVGRSLMELARDGGVDEIQALCGGCCSCATCHIYINPEDFSRLPEMSADEDELLDSSDHRRPTSRLACQIQFSNELHGLRVEVAPED